MKRKQIICVPIIVSMILLASCGNEKNQSSCGTEPRELDIIVSEERFTQAATEIETEPETSGGEEKPLFIDVEKNTDVSLSKVTLNNVEVDISDIKISELLSQTGLKLNSVGLMNNDTDYLFVGKMYHIDEGGTEIGIEAVDTNGELVTETQDDVMANNNVYSEENLAVYSVKGISTSDFWVEEDYEPLFTDGIKIGMLWNDAVNILGGEGEEGEFRERLFSDGNFILAIETEKNDEREDVISEITLVKR